MPLLNCKQPTSICGTNFIVCNHLPKDTILIIDDTALRKILQEQFDALFIKPYIPSKMLKPLHLDGVTYTPDFIRAEARSVMDIRGILIKQGHLPLTAAMLVVLALLNHLADNTSSDSESY